MNITKTNCTKFSIEKTDKIIYNMNMSVRKIKKSYLSCTGYFASYKNKNQVAFESVLERDLFMLLEFDTNVVKYEEQPMQVFYPFNDKMHMTEHPDTQRVSNRTPRKRIFSVTPF
ncbi:hypothetical protein LCX93_09720 [Sulfurimonas sp. SWIR-19]|uniref:hypothetical protein n=1 Tax=Sulfurimonas sp. SWIR-19 TaxID=2878390 RepID=UPI001CF5C5ED|nr:hypothetical protein [Sulfurimonas sp. SWIR-19]UCM99797.1 hypothetical protein LCX93_09720 [Sulfurimonas sp. SWIR-19]